jgi:hypothetical protein
MKPPVGEAIEEIRTTFPGCALVIREDAEGGAFLIVEDAPLAGPYQQATTWVGTHILYNYPYADTYPHFVPADLRRLDGHAVRGQGISGGHNFEGRSALQLSRRSNRFNPQLDKAAFKIQRVLKWLREAQS